jgi:hypothetical protein
MDTIIQKKGECAKDYLLRVAISYIDENTVHIYDGTECDGSCLIDDIKITLNLE